MIQRRYWKGLIIPLRLVAFTDKSYSDTHNVIALR